MTVRKRTITENVPPAIEAFCQFYLDTGDVLQSYNESHKHVNKVRASNLLASPYVWMKIIELSGSDECGNKHTRHLYEKTQAFIAEHGINPLLLYVECENGTKITTNPVKNLAILLPLWDFLVVLNRNKFLYETQKLIKTSYSHYKKLCDINAVLWKEQLTGALKGLRAKGTTTDIDDILNEQIKL